MFNCEKTQISGVLKNKAKIEELYMANVSGERYHIGKRVRDQNILNSMICIQVPIGSVQKYLPKWCSTC